MGLLTRRVHMRMAADNISTTKSMHLRTGSFNRNISSLATDSNAMCGVNEWLRTPCRFWTTMLILLHKSSSLLAMSAISFGKLRWEEGETVYNEIILIIAYRLPLKKDFVDFGAKSEAIRFDRSSAKVADLFVKIRFQSIDYAAKFQKKNHSNPNFWHHQFVSLLKYTYPVNTLYIATSSVGYDSLYSASSASSNSIWFCSLSCNLGNSLKICLLSSWLKSTSK